VLCIEEFKVVGGHGEDGEEGEEVKGKVEMMEKRRE
jgi:hypothetical protein